jgi:hypothetical protein
MMQAMKGFGTQPSHTFIEGAHLFSRTRARTLGDEALSALERWAPDASSLADAIGLPRNACEPLYDDVLRRLKHQPIQDFRIDFEDGYGFRPDSDEDGHAKWCAAEMAHAVREGIMPPFAGIRTRPFSAAFRARSERTIELFLTTLVQEASGLPVRFVVNLAKVTHTDEVTAVCDVLSSLEESLGLEPGVIALEFMIETPLALSDDEGRNPLRSVPTTSPLPWALPRTTSGCNTRPATRHGNQSFLLCRVRVCGSPMAQHRCFQLRLHPARTRNAIPRT